MLKSIDFHHAAAILIFSNLTQCNQTEAGRQNSLVPFFTAMNTSIHCCYWIQGTWPRWWQHDKGDTALETAPGSYTAPNLASISDDTHAKVDSEKVRLKLICLDNFPDRRKKTTSLLQSTKTKELKNKIWLWHWLLKSIITANQIVC